MPEPRMGHSGGSWWPFGFRFPVKSADVGAARFTPCLAKFTAGSLPCRVGGLRVRGMHPARRSPCSVVRRAESNSSSRSGRGDAAVRCACSLVRFPFGVGPDSGGPVSGARGLAEDFVLVAQPGELIEVEVAMAAAVKAAERAPRAELRRYPYGHFDIYLDPQVKADQVAFLQRTVLGVSA
jgi:hypothetical protein